MDEKKQLVKQLLDIRYNLKDLDLYDALTDFIESIADDMDIDSYISGEA